MHPAQRPHHAMPPCSLVLVATLAACSDPPPAADGEPNACQTPADEDLYPPFDFDDIATTPQGGPATPMDDGGSGGPPGDSGVPPGGGSDDGPPMGPGDPTGGAPGDSGGGGTFDRMRLFPFAPNEYGVASDLEMPGVVTPIFDDFAMMELLGKNGRHCETCHSNALEWGVTPAAIQRRFYDGIPHATTLPRLPTNDTATSNDELEPIFRTNDGTNSPNADVSTPAAREAAYSLLLSRAVLRIGLPVPEDADFELVEVDDPYGFASAEELSLFRRSPQMSNLRFGTTLMWDGRETLACETLTSSLVEQAAHAVTGHAQGDEPPDDRIAELVAAELGLYAAQTLDDVAGPLDEDGANGGPVFLAQQEFYWGINAFAATDPRGRPYDPEVFTLYRAWRELPDDGEQNHARRLIAEGERTFDTREFTVRGVSGLNDELGREELTATCGACHNTPNVGVNSEGRLMDIGVSDESRRTPDLPLYTFRDVASGATVRTSDPGQALVTKRWAHMNRFKVPQLRCLAGRAPYFHDGSAASLDAVVEHHDRRFAIGLTADEKAALVAFLAAL